ncbi:hypothetical protein M1446_00470, partial [Candidatus Dependentiae bacterium]|nr:hypothetical protein [Candidatus Dependentiae bacterium]
QHNPLLCVIFTADNLRNLDKGLIDRLDRIKLELPSKELRKKIIAYYLKQYSLNNIYPSDKENLEMIEKMAYETDFFSGRELFRLVKYAAIKYQLGIVTNPRPLSWLEWIQSKKHHNFENLLYQQFKKIRFEMDNNDNRNYQIIKINADTLKNKACNIIYILGMYTLIIQRAGSFVFWIFE